MGEVELEAGLNEALLSESSQIDFENARKQARFEWLDRFRGLIMIIMAWDHSKDMLVNLEMKGAEQWEGETPTFRNSFLFFFARAISNLCAPGFFFTMGISIVLFTISRLQKDWTFWDVIRHFLERSFVLILIDRVANLEFSMSFLVAIFNGQHVKDRFYPTEFSLNETGPVVEKLFLGTFEVMTCLGLVMALCAAIILPIWYKDYLKNKENIKRHFIIGTFLSIMPFIISNIVIVYYQKKHENDIFPGISATISSVGDLLVRMFFIPGSLGKFSRMTYPVIPWLGLCTFGMAFAFALKVRSFDFNLTLGRLALGFLIGFLVVRLFFGEFGNLRGWPRGDGKDLNFFIEFFWTLKYPPSIAYTLLTMGFNFLFMFLFSHQNAEDYTPKWFLDACSIFGKVPMFFYVMHLFLIGASTSLLGVLMGGFSGGHGTGYKAPYLWQNLFLWIPLLFVLLPLSHRYDLFKQTKPINSWWRML